VNRFGPICARIPEFLRPAPEFVGFLQSGQ
jgi:hypothetical protein